MKLPAHLSKVNKNKQNLQPRQAEQEEALVRDDRDDVTPAQAVENKLVSQLGRGALPVSHVRFATRALCSRTHC